MKTGDKVQICKVAAQAVLSDGRLTDEERGQIYRLMDRYELSEEQRADVLDRNIEDDVARLAAGLTEFDTKNELLVELAMAVAADGDISKPEQRLLESVADALEVDRDELEMLVKTALVR